MVAIVKTECGTSMGVELALIEVAGPLFLFNLEVGWGGVTVVVYIIGHNYVICSWGPTHFYPSCFSWGSPCLAPPLSPSFSGGPYGPEPNSVVEF